MKNVILIHAHVNVDQLNLLIAQLDDERHSIYVNLDRKCDIDPASVHPAARVVRERAAVRWADFSQVEQTLHSIAEIVATEQRFGHLVFISGQDFPVVGNEQLGDFLRLHGDRDFIHNGRIGPDAWAVQDRYEFHHYHGPSWTMAKLFRARRLAMDTFCLRRSMVGGLTPYGGSQWWMLTEAAVRYVVEFIARNPQYERFMRTVHCADEMFFQTILLNSPRRDSVVNDHKRYLDWSDCERGIGGSPNVLTEADFDKIVASGALFCRKVVLPRSDGLIRKLIERRTRAN
jgi:hypothetical protein